MKIVLYFSTAFVLFWLIHGAPSHHDPAKRNSIQHSNANRDRGKYLRSESASLQDKVLIKSESPLRGRKIHQTAWSKEENDGEKDQMRKQSDQKKINGPENSWNLDKILKYITSLVYKLDETEQPTEIWITSGDIEEKSHAKTNTKIKQKSTETDTEGTDEISKNKNKNSRRTNSSTYKNSYLEDYYEASHTVEKGDKYYEINQAGQNSSEYGNSDEDCDDESQINYKTNTKKHSNVKSNHLNKDDEEYRSNPNVMKSDASTSSQDSEDSEECFEDTDVNFKKNSQEVKNIKEFNEESNHSSNQKIGLEKRFEGIKTQLQSKTKKEGLAGKESHKFIVLNGTKVTGQNDKNSKNEGPLETTNILKHKSKVELSDIENEVNENTKEKVSINELKKLQKDSYVVEETVQTKNNNENIQNTPVSQSTNDEFTNSVIKLSVLSNGNGTKENKINHVMKLKPFTEQQENETSLTTTMETVYRNDNNLKNEVMNTEKVQNEETLVMTSSINNIAENNVNTLVVNPETLSDVTRQENMQTSNNEKVQNEETFVMTSSINNIAENNVNTLVFNPETLTDVSRQENIQIINNEETINNPVEMLTIQTNDAELNNKENKGVQHKTPELNISDIQIIEGNQDEFSQVNQISVTENNQQNYEYMNKSINKVNETLLISKDDNGFEYILGGNEFVPSDTYNEEIFQVLNNNNMVFNKNDSESKSQLLTELQNVQQVDPVQQETFDTILEFMYKHSKNPFILALKENSNSTN